MKKITVFTPTYNRYECLKICYESLVRQTNRNFIWQIIDDGSTDDTENLIKRYISEGQIDIQYFKKENGGKASAINLSLEITETDFWMCLDSDDFLFPNSIEKILNECGTIEDNDSVCGVFCVRSDKNGNPMTGKDIPFNVEFATQEEVRFKYSVNPEYAQIYKTEIIKSFPFPLVEGERFFTESWQQDQIDRDYVFKIIHGSIMACEYLPDGYTKHYYQLIKSNPVGFMIFYEQRVRIGKFFKSRFTAATYYNVVFGLCKDRKKQKFSFHWLILLTTIPGLLIRFIKFR